MKSYYTTVSMLKKSTRKGQGVEVIIYSKTEILTLLIEGVI